MKKLKIADGIHLLTMNVEDILFEDLGACQWRNTLTPISFRAIRRRSLMV